MALSDDRALLAMIVNKPGTTSAFLKRDGRGGFRQFDACRSNQRKADLIGGARG
jgi:hypothetical protein